MPNQFVLVKSISSDEMFRVVMELSFWIYQQNTLLLFLNSQFFSKGEQQELLPKNWKDATNTSSAAT